MWGVKGFDTFQMLRYNDSKFCGCWGISVPHIVKGGVQVFCTISLILSLEYGESEQILGLKWSVLDCRDRYREGINSLKNS